MDSVSFRKVYKKMSRVRKGSKEGTNSPAVMLEWADILVDFGYNDKAAVILLGLQETAGKDRTVLRRIGKIYALMGEPYLGDAIRAYRQTLIYFPEDAESYTQLGYLYWKKVHDLPEALRFFQRSLALNPAQVDAQTLQKVVDDLKSMYRQYAARTGLKFSAIVE